MSTFYRLIKALLPAMRSQKESDEAYLAIAVDIYDLERRMREIDSRGRYPASGSTYSLGLR